MDALNDLRVVLIHDWLTGMRGGEKVLETLCRRWPRRAALRRPFPWRVSAGRSRACSRSSTAYRPLEKNRWIR
jgi:hypothetical protein